MSEEILSRIAEWCAAEPDLDFADGTITMGGDPPLSITVDVGDDAVTLSESSEVATTDPGFADAANRLLSRRDSMIRGGVAVGADSTIVDVRYPLYLDGLSRHAFLLAIREVAGTVQALDELAAGPEPEPAVEPTPSPAEEQPAARTEETRVQEPIAAQPVAATPSMATTWAPTHAVPEGGISAWSEPDPALTPIARLAGRVELRLDEQRGAWARVTGSNGWTGWVDGRRLLPYGAPAARAAGAAAGLEIRPVPLIGGLLMILSSLLAWLPGAGTSLDGFDLPLALTWKPADTWFTEPISPEHPRIGLVLLLVGIVVVLLAVLPRVPAGLIVAVGALGLLVGVLFFLQIVRFPGIGFGDALDTPDIGFWLGLVGGLGAAVGGPIAPLRLGS